MQAVADVLDQALQVVATAVVATQRKCEEMCSDKVAIGTSPPVVLLLLLAALIAKQRTPTNSSGELHPSRGVTPAKEHSSH
jgi:hypothetical protein